jgi:hypothetical protein
MTPRPLELRHIAKKAECFIGRPAEGVEDLSSGNHCVQPSTAFGRALHRQKERQHPVSVRRPCILFQRLAQRNVLDLAMFRQPVRIGREKGKGGLLILPVLREVEVHAPDHIPCRVHALEELLHRCPGRSQIGRERFADIAPERRQNFLTQIFSSGHCRRCCGQQADVFRSGRKLLAMFIGIGSGAQGGNEAACELAPERECGREELIHLCGAKPEQTMSTPAGERLPDPSLKSRVQRRRIN